MNELSKAEKLLLAAFGLEQQGKRPFSAEDLVVAAWRAYPEAFALAGYPGHPDSNRVYFEIMGNKTFRKKGWLEKTGEKKYQLSPSGTAAASLLAGTTTSPADGGKAVPLGRMEIDRVQTLWLSTAAEMYRAGRQDEIVFRDACTFWGVSPRSTASTLAVRIGTVATLLDKVSGAVADSGPMSISHGAVHLGTDSVLLLSRVHGYLLKKFEGDLNIIRGRTDNRRPGVDVRK